MPTDKARILIVEDDPDSAQVLVDIIEPEFLVERAGSIKEAMVKAEEFRPHLVVSDVGLPDGNGIALARHLRAPTVLVTGQAAINLDEPWDDEPLIKFVLFKPVSGRTILNAIREALPAKISAPIA
jgi:CheY-like chemotaxis protein